MSTNDPATATRGQVRPPGRLVVWGAVLVALGVVLWVLSRTVASGEAHAFAPGSTPPRAVHLTQGTTYRLAVHGGVHTEQRLGMDPGTVRCAIRSADGTSTALRLTAEPADTKAVDTIATFTARFSGTVHVTCTGLDRVYVEGSGGGDPSGVLLVLATIALVLGVPLLLSGLRTRFGAGQSRQRIGLDISSP